MTISSTKTLNWYLLTSLSHYASPQVWSVLGTGPTQSTNLNKNHLRERRALSAAVLLGSAGAARGARVLLTQPGCSTEVSQRLERRAHGGRAGSIAAGAAVVPSPGRHPLHAQDHLSVPLRWSTATRHEQQHRSDGAAYVRAHAMHPAHHHPTKRETPRSREQSQGLSTPTSRQVP